MSRYYLALDADEEEGTEKRSTSVTFLGPSLLTPLLFNFGEAELDFIGFFFPIFSFIFLTCEEDKKLK